MTPERVECLWTRPPPPRLPGGLPARRPASPLAFSPRKEPWAAGSGDPRGRLTGHTSDGCARARSPDSSAALPCSTDHRSFVRIEYIKFLPRIHMGSRHYSPPNCCSISTTFHSVLEWNIRCMFLQIILALASYLNRPVSGACLFVSSILAFTECCVRVAGTGIWRRPGWPPAAKSNIASIRSLPPRPEHLQQLRSIGGLQMLL